MEVDAIIVRVTHNDICPTAFSLAATPGCDVGAGFTACPFCLPKAGEGRRNAAQSFCRPARVRHHVNLGIIGDVGGERGKACDASWNGCDQSVPEVTGASRAAEAVDGGRALPSRSK